MATHSTPGESHGQKSLTGYSPWGHKELDTTEQLTHTHTLNGMKGASPSKLGCKVFQAEWISAKAPRGTKHGSFQKEKRREVWSEQRMMGSLAEMDLRGRLVLDHVGT